MPPTIDPAPYRVPHEFLGTHHDRNARRTWMVVAITFVMMVIEIIAGVIFGSMALLADGVHMATHAGALAVAALAYRYARRHQHDSRFAFGTGKVGDLTGFASALVLAVIALLIGFESVERLLSPVSVAFNEAILVAVVGLLVNLVSAALLMHPHAREDEGEGDRVEAANAARMYDEDLDPDHDDEGQEHSHDHDHDHDHGDNDAHRPVQADAHHHADHNLLAAYVHVLADAVTSVLAIVALLAGRYLGWIWLDAAMGLVGAAVILRWSFVLMKQTGRVLLDSADPALLQRVRERLEREGACVSDLHIWRLGPGHSAVVATVVCPAGNKPDYFKKKLREMPTLSHVTVEVLDPKR
ncbi:MAG: cation diffusion facilitator family transporter [Gammaproteobacteria bacterium]